MNSRLSSALIVTIPVLVLALFQQPADAQVSADGTLSAQSTPFDISLVNGTWSPSSGKLSGQDLPESQLASIVLKIADGKYETHGTGFQETGKLVTGKPSAGQPQPIDVVIESGNNAGSTMLGIIGMNDDQLVVCFATTGDRPVRFESTLENETLLLKYNRVPAGPQR